VQRDRRPRTVRRFEPGPHDRHRSSPQRRIDPAQALKRELRDMNASDSHAQGVPHWSDVQYIFRAGYFPEIQG
jgi:hypothetical protein